MSIQVQLDQDLKQAMISKDEVKLSVIRFLKSAIKYVAIEKKLTVMTDADILPVLQKQVKQRRESIDQFVKAGREDLASKEKAEVAVLELYLPKQMSDDELKQLISDEIKAAGATSKKDFGRMMKIINEKIQGRAEAKRVSEILGQALPA